MSGAAFVWGSLFVWGTLEVIMVISKNDVQVDFNNR